MESKAMNNEERARILIDKNYFQINNDTYSIARIDREDWKTHILNKLHPYNMSLGIQWINNHIHIAEDIYRRFYSQDVLSIDKDIYKLIPKSSPLPRTRNAAQYLRAIPSAKRAEASRQAGIKYGGRPPTVAKALIEAHYNVKITFIKTMDYLKNKGKVYSIILTPNNKKYYCVIDVDKHFYGLYSSYKTVLSKFTIKGIRSK